MNRSSLSQANVRPARRVTPVMIVTLGIAAAGLLAVCAALALFAAAPASTSDPRPRLAALLASVTPAPTMTPLPDAAPTTSPTSTIAPTQTPSGPTPVPPTPTITPYPPLTPDGVTRTAFLPIMMYHYVSVPPADADVYRVNLSTTPENLRAQMQWLKDNGYTTISLYDLAYYLYTGKPELPPKPIVLTFDDGYADNYENAFPILKEFGFTGTFFILTDVTDRNEPGYMTWEMYREMSAAGMSIEVHGREHFDMTGHDAAWLLFHQLGPAQTIEANLGYIPRILCYPAGKYDEQVIVSARENGYWVAVTTMNGATHSTGAPFELQRVRVDGDWTIDRFSAVVSALTQQ